MNPPTFRRHDVHLNVLISSDLKLELKALSWVAYDDEGRLSHTVRKMLRDNINDWKEENPDKVKEFENVLENLYLQKELKAQKVADELEKLELSE